MEILLLVVFALLVVLAIGRMSGVADRDVASAIIEPHRSFVKFLGDSADRAGLARPVRAEVESSGCNWALCYPANKRPRRVQDGSVMLIGRTVEGPDIRVFGRAVGRSYEDGDDATPGDIRRRPFKSHWRHYIRVHGAEFIDGALGDGVSLNELMETLGSDAFASTARNAAAGAGNVDPRRAYRQQAQVELTPEAEAWLQQRLEKRLEAIGRVPNEFLNGVD